MPQFNPSVSKTAMVSLQVQPSGLSCQVEVFLGPNVNTKVVTSSLIPFTSTGGQQQINLPVVMPSSPGTYYVFIFVYSGGEPFLTYIATENVVITSLPLTMAITSLTSMGDKYSSYWVFEAKILITNNNTVAVTRKIKCQATYGEYNPNDPATTWWERTLENQVAQAVGSGVPWFNITLQPGQSINLTSPYYYIGVWRELQQTYEWPNWPVAGYKSGVMKKYWCRVIDEVGNISQLASIGTALSW